MSPVDSSRSASPRPASGADPERTVEVTDAEPMEFIQLTRGAIVGRHVILSRVGEGVAGRAPRARGLTPLVAPPHHRGMHVRPSSHRRSLSRWVIAACLAAACGDDGDDGPNTATTQAATTSLPSTSSGDESSAGTAAGSSTGVGESTTDPVDTSGAPTTGGPSSACDPPMAPFLAHDGALPQAAILLDFDGASCAAASQAGEAPQVVLDVKASGLVDATLFGLEIVSVSSGQPFDDPPTGDSEVIDLIPDLAITFEATRVDDGTPVTISFEIFSTGPTLLDASVEFG